MESIIKFKPSNMRFDGKAQSPICLRAACIAVKNRDVKQIDFSYEELKEVSLESKIGPRTLQRYVLENYDCLLLYCNPANKVVIISNS